MAASFVCTSCGYVGRPASTVKGSILIEILLWCFFLVPGIIYSIWRISTKQSVCPKCRRATMIPSDTPVGAKLAQANATSDTAGKASSSNIAQSSMAKPRDTKRTLKIIGLIVLALISLPFWYVAIPAFACWYLWKMTKLKPRTKIIIGSLTAVAFLASGYAVANANRAPTLMLTEPMDNASVQASTVTVQGKVEPAGSIVKVGEQVIARGGDGSFRYDAPLPSEKNVIQITASNADKTTTVTLNVVRLYTEAEKAEQARLRAEADAKQQAALEAQKKAQAEAAAKAKAEQAAFDASRAGKICKKHPTWSQEVCQNVADHKYWIGMDIDMLKASYGRLPDHANPSNYGSGTQWQWCWSDMTPSCFYGADDGIITSYN